MISHEEFAGIVRAKLNAAGVVIESDKVVNRYGNRVLDTSKGLYILKQGPRYGIGGKATELGSGSTVGLDLDLLKRFADKKPYFLFNYVENDKIYGIDHDSLIGNSTNFLQEDGQWTRHILTKKVPEWKIENKNMQGPMDSFLG